MSDPEVETLTRKFDAFAHVKAALALSFDVRKYVEDELARGITPSNVSLAAAENLLVDATRHIVRARELQRERGGS